MAVAEIVPPRVGRTEMRAVTRGDGTLVVRTPPVCVGLPLGPLGVENFYDPLCALWLKCSFSVLSSRRYFCSGA